MNCVRIPEIVRKVKFLKKFFLNNDLRVIFKIDFVKRVVVKIFYIVVAYIS